MAVLKGVSRSKRSESLSGKFMVDTVRGQLRVRKWPKKRGTPKSALQRWWIDWFRQANKLAKYVDAATARRAIDLTAGTGMYPRDIILSAMRGRLYSWVDQTGKKWHSMAAIQDISDSLDVLAQNIGDVLVRAADRWRAPPAGLIGDTLTYQGPDDPPIWTAPSAGGGGPTCLLTNTTTTVTVSGVDKVISWDTENEDDYAGHDPAVNPSRIVMPAGYARARATAVIRINGFAGGSAVQTKVLMNGGDTTPGTLARTASQGSSYPTFLQVSTPNIPISEGDYFEAAGTQWSGSNQNILGNAFTWFQVELLNPT